MPGRKDLDDDPRHLFNGMEADAEVSGEGNSYTTQFRQYDPRLGRWKSIDPVTKVHESPYALNGNNPIWFADPSGADSVLSTGCDNWEWKMQDGDDLTIVSEKTGVSLENLKKWNPEITKYDDIPIGTHITLVDPSEEGNGNNGSFDLADGTIQIGARQSTSKNNGGRQYMSITFTPGEDDDSHYFWFQSGQTNDPVNSQGNSNRQLSPNEDNYFEDIWAGFIYATFGKGQTMHDSELKETGETIIHPPGSYSFFDAPSRGASNASEVRWHAMLQLHRICDNGETELVGTFYYGFTMNGTDIVSDFVYFNPNGRISEGLSNFNLESFTNKVDKNRRFKGTDGKTRSFSMEVLNSLKQLK